MKRLNGLVLAILFLALIQGLMVACSADDGAGGQSSSSSTSSSGSAAGGSGGSGEAGGGGGGVGGGGGAAGTVGACGRTCSADADCCPPGVPNCPGGAYPSNFACDAGICRSPRCSVKEDCTAGGTLPNDDCVTIASKTSCARRCAVDADCSAGATCSGVDDAGDTLCKTSSLPFMCTGDADCRGFGKCNEAGDGCYCGDSSDCSDFYSNSCLL